MKNYKLIVFDLAGTTVTDTNTVGSCLQAALLKAGLEVTVDDVNSVMGIRKPVAIQELLTRYDHAGNVDEIYESFRSIMIETYQTSAEMVEIPGTTETFKEIRNLGLKIAVDTGFERDITDVLLDRMGWGELVDDSITSDEVETGRPAPDMIFELCRRLAVDPQDVVKVGDTPADIYEGKNAGAALVIGVLYGTHSREQLESCEPDVLIDDIRQIPGLLV